MADVEMEDASKGKQPVVKTESDAEKKKRLEIKKWNAVTLWSWDIVVDNCAICRNHIMDLCKCAAPRPAPPAEKPPKKASTDAIYWGTSRPPLFLASFVSPSVRHRVPGEPVERDERGVHGGLGIVQPW